MKNNAVSEIEVGDFAAWKSKTNQYIFPVAVGESRQRN